MAQIQWFPGHMTKAKREIEEKIKIQDGKTNEFKDLDSNQIARFYNYFKFVKPNEKNKDLENCVDDYYCLYNNAEQLLFEKLTALFTIGKMNSGSTWNDIEPNRLLYILNNYFAVVSNLFFNLASSRTNQELEEILSGCVEGLDGDKIIHLRNSLCHGRYFHDFNKTFYFYDGQKELDFKLKLTVEDINKILDKIAAGKFEIVSLKKFD